MFANLADLFVAEEGIRHPDQSGVCHREVADVPCEYVMFSLIDRWIFQDSLQDDDEELRGSGCTL